MREPAPKAYDLLMVSDIFDELGETIFRNAGLGRGGGVPRRDDLHHGLLGPRAWRYAVRNAGELVYLGGEVGAPQLRYIDAPDSVLDDDVYLHSVAASFEAAIWYAGMRGRVAFSRVDAGIDFAAGWHDVRGCGDPGDAMGA